MNSKQWVNLFFIGISTLLIMTLISTFFIYDKFPENSLRKKEYLIKDNTPKIIFAGDSRAERQLSVSTALNTLGYSKGDIVNIAISSGDPIALNNLVDKYPNKFKNSIVFVSMSANQLNDNARTRGYFTYSMISKLSYTEQIMTFIPNNILTLASYYYSVIRPYPTEAGEFRNTYGFNPIDGTLQKKQTRAASIKRNEWYKNYADKGLKYDLISASLSDLNNKVGKLYVYTAPFAPSYLSSMEKYNILNFEKLFKTRIMDICYKNNITCINYLKINELNDSHFYDGAHTNKNGAIIFTKKVLKDFGLTLIQ